MVELLTVMSIMAILAAILFPVFAQVKEKARQNGCMSNLREIGSYISLYKLDNRQYPKTLGPEVDDPTKPSPIDYRLNSGLFSADYIKSYQTLHCPSDSALNTKDIVKRADGVFVYAYSNYDTFIINKQSYTTAGNGAKIYNNFFQIYGTSWCDKPEDMPAMNIEADGVTDSPAERAADFERQLKWKNPPSDTVVTWCANHAQNPFDIDTNGKYMADGLCMVLFLDGHVDKLPAQRVAASLWRVRPKK